MRNLYTTFVLQENGEQPAQKWRPGGPALSSFTGSGRYSNPARNCVSWCNNSSEDVCVDCCEIAVAGKDLEQEREMEGGMEWKDRIDKWKTKQEKRGKLNRDDDDDDDDKNDDEYML